MIIVAASLTDQDTHPLNSAIVLAQRLHEPIFLVHVLAPIRNASMNDRRATAIERLTWLARSVSTAEVDVHPEILDGEVVEALHACASRLRPRLMVIGGREGEAYEGSNHVADRLSRLLPCPCLVSGKDGALVRHPSADTRLRALVAVDRSSASDTALEQLAYLRETMPLDCDVVTFYWPPDEQRRLNLPRHSSVGADPAVASAITDELSKRVSTLPGNGELSVRALPLVGTLGLHIADEARARGADFILIGSHQRGALGGLLHGSVTQQLLRDATVPVMFAPLSSREPRGAMSEPKRIMVLTDLTDFGNRALAYAYVYFRNCGGIVDLVHVLTPESDASLQRGVDRSIHGLATSRELAIGMLQSLVPDYAETYGIETCVHVLNGIDVAAAVAEHAATSRADAVCLASHGSSALRGALGGSVVTSVVHLVDRPVLIVR